MYSEHVFHSWFIRVTDEGLLLEISLYGSYYLLLNVFTASKGSKFYTLIHVKMFLMLSMLILLQYALKKIVKKEKEEKGWWERWFGSGSDDEEDEEVEVPINEEKGT